jgi:septum formation protein
MLGLDGHRLVLASASPRRADLLRGLGIPFEARPVTVLEALVDGEAPRTAAVRLAAMKAKAAVRPSEDALVLAADTLVVLDDQALGKPRDDEDARHMLRRLSGRMHEVVTGVAVVRSRDDEMFAGWECTRVSFRNLRDKDIEILVESGEATDKAGAYGIQGLASLVVDSVEGDYFNVVGLPLGLLQYLLGKAVTRDRETGSHLE